MSDAYLEALSTLERETRGCWNVTREQAPQFTWLTFSTARRLAAQGWKIHVSAGASEADRFVASVSPILLRWRRPFKLPGALQCIEMLNAGEAGDSQVGKVLTVYARSADEATRIARDLDAVWATSAGPLIATDLRLRPDGAVGLRYGAFTNEHHIVDAAGLRQGALLRPDGVLVVDRRASGRYKPAWIRGAPIRGYVERRRAPSLLTIDRRPILPLSLLSRTGRCEVHLAISIGDGSTCITKTARHGVAGDRRGHDSQSRLGNEFTILRRLSQSGCHVGPEPFGLERRKTTVLLLEDLDGDVLSELDRETQHAHFADLAAAVDHLHDHGIAHRDIKLSNTIATRSGVRLIDFELAAPFGASDMPLGGTRNYGIEEERVSREGDRFSLASTWFAIVTGCDPATLPDGRGRLMHVLRSLGTTREAALYADLALRIDDRRLHEIVLHPRSAQRRSTKTAPASMRRWSLRASSEAARSTREFWRGNHWANRHVQFRYPAEGINLGAAGIVLGLLSIDHALKRRDSAEDVVRASEWLCERTALLTHGGLFMGSAGVAVALAVAGRRFHRADFVAASRALLGQAIDSVHGCDLFGGAAGVLWAASVLATLETSETPLERTERLAARLLKSTRKNGTLPVWPTARHLGEGGALFGAAHGSAGIALALALWGRLSGSRRAVTLAAETLHALFRLRRSNGWPRGSALDAAHPTPGDWCHGAAGMLWCLLEAFDDDPAFVVERDTFIDHLLEVPPVANPTFCHGLAGQLDLWRMVSRLRGHAAEASARAAVVASVLRGLQVRGPMGASWTSESASMRTPDLWVGFLGPASQLAMAATQEQRSLFSPSWLADISKETTCFDESLCSDRSIGRLSR